VIKKPLCTWRLQYIIRCTETFWSPCISLDFGRFFLQKLHGQYQIVSFDTDDDSSSSLTARAFWVINTYLQQIMHEEHNEWFLGYWKFFRVPWFVATNGRKYCVI
jgi:hypothetical protein